MDRYTEAEFWNQGYSQASAGDWGLLALACLVVVVLFSAIRQGEYRKAAEREAEWQADRASIPHEMARIYGDKGRDR